MTINPRALAILVRRTTGIKLIVVDAISDAPIMTITSLGEGGKMFSVKEKMMRIT
jgi:hypothetical protein